MENQKSNLLTGIKFFLLAAILILVSSAFIFILKEKNKELVVNQEAPSISPPQNIISANKTGFLTIGSVKNQYSPGQLIEMEIVANSAGSDITGYDLIVAYNPQVITFKEAQSLVDDFKIYPFDEKNYLSLTAIKDLKSQREMVFNKIGLVKLIFSAKTRGETEVIILPKLDKKETFFVDKNTQKIYPVLSSYKITIK